MRIFQRGSSRDAMPRALRSAYRAADLAFSNGLPDEAIASSLNAISSARSMGKVAPPRFALRAGRLLIERHQTADAEAVAREGAEAHPGNVDLANLLDQAIVERGIRAEPTVWMQSDPARMPPSLENLCIAIWEAERHFDLAAWTINGAHPWVLARMSVFLELAQALDLFDYPHPARRRRLAQSKNTDLMKCGEAHYRRLTRRNLLGWSLSRRDFAVWAAGRQLDGDEPVSAPLRTALAEEAICFDRTDEGNIAKAYNVPALDAYCFREFAQPSDSRIAADDLVKMYKVARYLEGRLGVRLKDLRKTVQRRTVHFLSLRRGFRKIFNAQGTKAFFVVNSYNPTTMAAIAAARENGARVIELQHGLFSRYQLGYSWPDQTERIAYFPDELWCFGRYWPETTPLPPGVKIHTIGFQHRFGGRSNLAAATSDRRKVLVISQGSIGEKLWDWTLRAAFARPELDFVFRPHPNEARTPFEDSLNANDLSNLSISVLGSIYDEIATADILFGVYSTAMFEGLSLGLPAIVADLPGKEHIAPAVESGDVVLARTPEDLIKKLPLVQPHSSKNDYLSPLLEREALRDLAIMAAGQSI